MARGQKNETGSLQAAQSQPADAESKVKENPDPSQSQSLENEVPDNTEQQGQQTENEAPDNTEQQSQPHEGETQEASEAQQNQKANAEEPPTFVIICRNKINKMIGGVSFVGGIGHTSDGFTASWFGNKDGYEVRNNGL